MRRHLIKALPTGCLTGFGMTKTARELNVPIFLILFGALLLPRIPLSKLQVRVSDIVTLSLLPLIFLLSGKIKKSIGIFYLVILLAFMATSTVFGYIFLRVPTSLRDANELARMLIPLLLLVACLNIRTKSLEYTITYFFKIGTPFIVILSLLEYYIAEIIPVWLLNQYGGEAHVNLMLTRESPRIIATGTDPNIGGTILLLFFFYHIASFINQRNRLHLIWSILLLLLLSFSASRTVLFAFFFVVIIVTLFTRQIKTSIKVLSFSVLILFAIFIWIRVAYVRIGIQQLYIGQNNSWLARVRKFHEALLLFYESPILGWGPAKAIHSTVVDGEYLLLLRRYGLIGITVFISFLIWSLHLGFKISRYNYIYNEKKTNIPVFTFLCYSLAIFVIMISNNFLSGYQLIVPYIVLLGYIESLSFVYNKHFPLPKA